MKRLAMILALALVALSAAAVAGEVTVLRVIDGDTLEVWNSSESCMVDHRDKYGRTIPCPDSEFSVRLIGVDAPESRSNAKASRDAEEWGVNVEQIIQAGRKAKSFVEAFAPPGSVIRIDDEGKDKYGRTLAYVYLVNGKCLNEVMVRDGYAIAPSRYPHRDRGRYRAFESEAKRRGRGFWLTLWRTQSRYGED